MTGLTVIMHWTATYLLPCFYKQVFGISCPLCGSQRSVILLCEGRIWDSMKMFPPLLPLAITLLLVCLRRLSGSPGKKTIWIALVIDAILLLFNMVYQNVAY